MDPGAVDSFFIILLVCVYGLGTLAESVEARGLFRAMEPEGVFAGMLSKRRGEQKNTQQDGSTRRRFLVLGSYTV